MEKVVVIGAGLAGCEAAWQIAKRGHKVALVEMKPKKMTPAHSASTFCELVCSNSLKSEALNNASGLLKEEMRLLDSLVIKTADNYRVPAGSALAVDRDKFSSAVTEVIKNHPNIEVIEEEMDHIPDGPVIIASGPLTSSALMEPIKKYVDDKDCYFYDAEAPLVTTDSIDFTKAYRKSRYDKGDADYINCPMTEEEFNAFYDALITAETVELKEFEKEIYFEGCMPFEVMAKRGKQTLLFGPMKPVGLEKDGKRPFAVVQLRQDNLEGTIYNIVGFQTNLTKKKKKKILHMIPGLENCEIVRYGVMHRNTYINSPNCLKETFQTKKRDDLFFAGQISGVEGYVESAASGLIAGINMARLLEGKELIVFGNKTVIGALPNYIVNANADNFQPMNANFGIVHLEDNVKKKDRKEAYAKQSLKIIEDMIKEYDI